VSLVLGLLIGLVVGAALAVGVVRRRTADRLDRLADTLQPDRGRLPAAGFGTSFERLERVVERQHEVAAAAEAALDGLRRALETLPTGVVITDEAGGVVMRNSAAEHFLGVHHADALVDEAVTAHLRAALTGSTGRETLDLFGPPHRSIVVTAVPVASQSGKFGALATIEDVTDRSRLEAMRSDFVSNISHELKTPVGALALLAETLVGEDDPEVVGRLGEKMVLEAHRLARIIEDLLELSRIELAESLHAQTVSLGVVVSQAIERVRHFADRQRISVEVHDPVQRVVLVGDRRQLVSAVANLVENGLKYSEPGSVVEVTARYEATWVDIVVTDHGIGIPARDLDRIFERFYRVDRARGRETGGTGLGLAIVRHVATNHGGSVHVTSQEGVGSTFTLRIPSEPIGASEPVIEEVR
jgi:two-component system sensor histidine kinase SenX3